MIFQPAAFLRNQSRPVLALLTAIPFLFVICYLFLGVRREQPTGDLHLLIPATSSNLDLCKLLLTASILHYPIPALINWGAHENKDAYVQHLAKVDTILSYLHKLEAAGASEDDLIFILDGFDVWLQLSSEVLLKRYFQIIEATDGRTQELYGQDARHTILFGPDKICWPIDFTRPACWAVPPLPLDDRAWGPPSRTHEHNMPRWLNSGTILGPLGDMRDMFQATLDLIKRNHTTDSDQFYFANVWGDQEYARLTSDPVRLQARMKSIDPMERNEFGLKPGVRSPAELVPGRRTDYFISLDYLSELFQTLAFNKLFLVWMRPDHSWRPAPGKYYPASEHYQFNMPQDVLDSPRPYSDLQHYNKTTKAQSNLLAKTWGSLVLCINTVTNQVPVTLHFTGEKPLRDIWWRKLWLQPDGKLLREASLAVPERPLNRGKPIAGKVWSNGLPPNSTGDRSGAMGDNEEFLTWDSLCAHSEKQLYAVDE